MREQVVTPRTVGRGSATGGKARGGNAGPQQQQRPAPRRAKPSAGQGRGSLGKALRYFPVVAKVLLAVCAGLLVFKGYNAMAAATFFQVKSIEVEGAARVTPDEIKAAVERAAGTAGVWKADLDAISSEIKELKWVRSASVARVLPSGFRVRVTERVPRLVARNSAGTFDWVDEDGVILGKASVTDPNSSFFIRGLDETTTELARRQNRERIVKALEMEREWKSSGLIERISEVNLDNLKDVRAQLSGDYSQIQVFLGEKDFGKRLARAFKALAEVPSPSPRGPVTYLDATRDKGVTVGFSSNRQPQTEAVGFSDAGTAPGAATTATSTNAHSEPLKTPARKTEAKKSDTVRRKADERQGKAQTDAQRRARADAQRGPDKPRAASVVAAQRPRRVGH